MNHNLKLIRNQGFPWFNYKDKIYVKGFVYNKDNKILRELDFINFIIKDILKDEISSDFLKDLNGSFAIIYYQNEKIIIISDKLNSFPIFYKINQNNCTVSDDYYSLIDENSELMPFNVEQLILAGYVLSNETIHNNILQSRACELLTISNNSYKRITYYFLVKSNNDDYGLDFYKEKYLDVITNIGSRLLNGAENRQLLLFLSAGYDSRLIANMLHQGNYKNVITVTYGAKDSYEKESAKNIAEKYGFEWYFIEYSADFLRKFIKKDDFLEFAKFSANGTSRPHIQDIFVLDYLMGNNIIDKETIVVNGNRARINISDYYGTSKELLSFDTNKTINHLININFITNDNNLRINLFEKIERILSAGTPPDQMDDWNLKEFISKFLFNLCRNYNFFGVEYRAPLLDNEFLNFIKDLPINLKQDYKFYPNVNNELIFRPAGVDFTNSGYSNLKKIKLVSYLLKKQSVKKFITNKMERFMSKYKDPNNLEFIIREIYPAYIRANTREEWYNYNVSRWYLEKFIK